MTALFDNPIVGWALGGLVVILLSRDLINNWIDNQQVALECSDGDYKGYSLITYPSLADEDGRIKVLEFLTVLTSLKFMRTLSSLRTQFTSWKVVDGSIERP